MKSIGAGNDKRALALRGWRKVPESGYIATVWQCSAKESAGAGNSAPDKRSEEEFAA